MSGFAHVSVLLREAVEALAPRDGGFYVDATLGGAGHASAILEASAPTGQLLGLDRDPDAIAAATNRLAPFGDRVTIRRAPFSDVREVVDDVGFGREVGGAFRIDGLLADIGVSSHQLDAGHRGFSFHEAAPLDMRMGQSGETADDLIARLDVDGLTDIFRRYGEIRDARRLARAVKNDHDAGLVRTTTDLAGICGRVLGRQKDRIHPATLPFQALRIAVNDKLGELETLLTAIPDLLAVGGIAAIISFHSLEDRLVKHTFRRLASPPQALRGLPLPADALRADFELVGGLVRASDAETADNPRARSARLRAIRRIRRQP